MNKMYKVIKEKYSLSNIKQETEGYVKRCKSCQVNKILRTQRKAPMEITTTAHQPFKKCSLDVVSPLTEPQKGNKYILIFQDELSKFLVACPIQKQDAEKIARKFVTHIILKMGTPKTVLTDQCTNFMSEI
jgi:hypothetical protein